MILMGLGELAMVCCSGQPRGSAWWAWLARPLCSGEVPTTATLCNVLCPPPPAPPLQVAFIGFCVQALVTRTGPIENLTSHLSK